jgi:hypothetical protein
LEIVMQVNVRFLDHAAADLATFVEHRVRFAMRRRADAVPQVTVRLEDLNGPRGGPDKECRIALSTRGHGTLVARALATTWRSAVHAALQRVVQLLARELGRNQAQRRASAQTFDSA